MKEVVEYSWSIKTKTDELVVRKNTFQVLPKIKFKRKKEKKVRIAKEELGVFKLKIPFQMMAFNRSRTWIGNGFQTDDIMCSEEWVENLKVYDKIQFYAFLKECCMCIGIPIETKFNECQNGSLI